MNGTATRALLGGLLALFLIGWSLSEPSSAAQREGLTEAQGDALFRQAADALVKGDLKQAAGLYETAAEVFESLGNRERWAWSLSSRASTLVQLGRLAEAEADATQALALYSSLLDDVGDSGDRGLRQQYLTGRATSLQSWRKVLEHNRNYSEARLVAEDELEAWLEIGHENPSGPAYVTGELGHLAELEGDYEAAVDYYRGSVRFWQESEKVYSSDYSQQALAKAQEALAAAESRLASGAAALAAEPTATLGREQAARSQAPEEPTGSGMAVESSSERETVSGRAAAAESPAPTDDTAARDVATPPAAEPSSSEDLLLEAEDWFNRLRQRFPQVEEFLSSEDAPMLIFVGIGALMAISFLVSVGRVIRRVVQTVQKAQAGQLPGQPGSQPAASDNPAVTVEAEKSGISGCGCLTLVGLLAAGGVAWYLYQSGMFN